MVVGGCEVAMPERRGRHVLFCQGRALTHAGRRLRAQRDVDFDFISNVKSSDASAASDKRWACYDPKS
jgi:hypothetical protein